MKTLQCSDVGFKCEHVVRAATVEAVMQQAAEHARTVHNVEVTAEQAAQIQQLIRDEAQDE